jgi:integrase
MASLTARKAETVKEPGYYGAGGGLYLQVMPKGGKTWIYRYQIAGRRRDMGLGSASDPATKLSLADAREKALAARKLVKAGIDPIEARTAKAIEDKVETAKATTFREATTAYIDAHKAAWRNAKHAAQWTATLTTYAHIVFGDLPVSAIDTGLVMRALQPIWATKPETASRVRGRIESILDWATVHGFRHGENPARWKGHLQALLPAKSKVAKVEHHAALPYGEIPDFMAALRVADGMAARALRFAILTAGRTGEVLGATWAEIDLEGRLWAIPSERMKAGKEHRVPLSEPAAMLLRDLATARKGQEHAPGDPVFPGAVKGKALSNMALLMALRRLGREDLTAHGFRSTFRDWVAEQTNFPSEVAEMALAHTVGDKVEAAYRRGDMFEKRQKLAEAWGAWCCSPAGGGKVVAMPSARAS